MADAQAAAAAGKKKYKSKKNHSQNPNHLEAPTNGHVQEKGDTDREPAEDEEELRRLIKQLHLCNGHGAKEQAPPASPPLEVLNGHSSSSNNNHIRSTGGGSNNNHSSHKSVDSSNNNRKQGESEDLHHHPEESKTTANTLTQTTGSGKVDKEEAAEATTTPIIITAEPQLPPEPAISAEEIVYKEYEAEHQMHDIMRLIQAELSEPYSIYTYRYFIYNWPKLCFLASHDNQYVGAIVCKLDMHMNVRRGYIAMLAVRKEYRKLKIGTTLVTKAIEAMLADNADEVVLETEMRNQPALRLYENLGFVRDKRLFRYYLNGVDALRLKLWFR
ncbi:N-alpha-acetyltransferase 30A [Drosophila takahashii]|uniref:N-alpha-acetyltransferase 30A n=1 Tax=Drosophila takahashii TaxID=29030 RepID=UPI001CF906E4|nr:N-alpha-acetyltransferase 30A [Drosophila takahashii]